MYFFVCNGVILNGSDWYDLNLIYVMFGMVKLVNGH